jgi:hypothetical protein
MKNVVGIPDRVSALAMATSAMNGTDPLGYLPYESRVPWLYIISTSMVEGSLPLLAVSNKWCNVILDSTKNSIIANSRLLRWAFEYTCLLLDWYTLTLRMHGLKNQSEAHSFTHNAACLWTSPCSWIVDVPNAIDVNLGIRIWHHPPSSTDISEPHCIPVGSIGTPTHAHGTRKWNKAVTYDDWRSTHI